MFVGLASFGIPLPGGWFESLDKPLKVMGESGSNKGPCLRSEVALLMRMAEITPTEVPSG